MTTDAQPEGRQRVQACNERLTHKPPPGRPGRLRGSSSVVTSLAAIGLAFLCGSVLVAVSNAAALAAWGRLPAGLPNALWLSVRAAASAYYALIQGAIVDPSAITAHSETVREAVTPISTTLAYATPLAFGGLAVAVAFRAGLINIGVQGQMVLGAIAAGWVSFGPARGLPIGIHLIVAIVGGCLAGALWGAIAGFLKAVSGAHEVITTLMLDYIAVFALQYVLTTAAFQRPGHTDPLSRVVPSSARLPHLASSLPVESGLFVALLAAVATGWLLRRSTIGFALRAVGSNAAAARTAGIRVGRSYIIAMLIAGALGGLVGVDQLLGQQHSLTPGFDGGIGFTAITVALVGRANVPGVLAAALLFGALQAGGDQMQVATQTPYDLVTIIQALIVLFVVAPALIAALLRTGNARTPGTTLQIETTL